MLTKIWTGFGLVLLAASGSLSFNTSGGACKLKKQKGTSFLSVYEADSNATYMAEFPYSSYCNYKDSGDYGSVCVAGDDEYLVIPSKIIASR